MKRIYLGLCLFVLLGNQCLRAGLNDGLMAFYPFNGNANDASGNNNNGSLFGNPNFTADRYGQPGKALHFDGVSDYVWLGSGLRYGNMTACVWFKTTYQTGLQWMIRDRMFGWGLTTGAPDSLNVPPGCITIYPFNTQDAPDPGSMFVLPSPGTSYNDGQWHFATLTYDGLSLILYADGIPCAKKQYTNASSIYYEPGGLAIGRAGDYSGYYFSGDLDDVRIYNRALSASEVQQLYSLPDIGPAPTPPTLVPINRTPTSAETGGQISGNFRVFTGGSFVTGVALDPGKLTIVMTHGWNDSSDTWPSNMARQFVAAGISANLVAWDWRDDATSDFTVSGCEKVLLKTPNQGLAFGTNLLQSLGAGYSQPIHFIGHSFGTLVNAAAANYLEAHNFSSAKMQVTLLDEAEIANDLTVVNPAAFNLGWIKPLPKSYAWSDNYVSAVGFLQEFPNVVNVILTKNQQGSVYTSVDDLWNALKVYHGTPCEWYGETITNPAGSVMGDIWSFERNSSFTTPAPGTFFLEQDSGLGLEQINQSYAEKLREIQIGSLLPDAGVAWVLDEIHPAVSIVGDVTANLVETAITDSTPVYVTTPATIGISTYAPATPLYWSPQFILQNHPINLQSNLKPLGVHPLDGSSSTSSNAPAYVWLPMTIPTNATSMSFDFMLQGDGAGDSFDVALNGTNVFSLVTSLIQTNVTLNSGLIDVSQYAGTNVELFFGIVGGNSTNTSLTVSGIRLYIVMPPLLQAQASGNNFVLSWPLSATNFVLQTSTNLADPNSWTSVPNVTAIVNLQNTVTNPISGGAQFYRLKQ